MASNIPAELKYSKEHEWVKVEGDIATIGITDFAQSSLGDVVFVELPEVGRTLNAGQTFGVVESIKSVSDLYAPVSGSVIESNTDLPGAPELCNQGAYDKAWMIKVKMTNSAELSNLLSAKDYENFLASL